MSNFAGSAAETRKPRLAKEHDRLALRNLAVLHDLLHTQARHCNVSRNLSNIQPGIHIGKRGSIANCPCA